MKKLIVVFLIVMPAMFFLGCSTTKKPTYQPGSNNDYIYSIGYYGNGPYWAGSGWRNGYWLGFRGVNDSPRLLGSYPL